MPPDILMVLHSHMLNPRSFLEDTIRSGLSSLWTAGMPWKLVSEAIGADLSYATSNQAKQSWVARTGRNWANQDDSLARLMVCPFCQAENHVPWTTCGMSEKPGSDDRYDRGH